MKLIDRRTASILFTIVAFTLLLASIYRAREPLTAFLFAILFAYLINPIVDQCQAMFHCRRGIAVLATYILLGVIVTGLGITAGPRVFRQGVTLGKELPTLMETVGSGEIAQQYGSLHSWDYETQIEVQRFLVGHREVMSRYTQAAVDHVAGLAGNLLWLILIPIMAAFLLKDHAHFCEELLQLISDDRDRAFCRSVLRNLDAMLVRFIRAQLAFATLGLIAYTTFLLIAKFPYGMAVGVIAGLLEFIPFVGPLITFILIMGMAVLMGYKHWLAAFVFLALWRGMQDYITSPYLLGRGVRLHPLAVLCGVLIGGEIAGVVGLFLAVPVLASFRIIWTAWRLWFSEEEKFRGASPELPDYDDHIVIS